MAGGQRQLLRLIVEYCERTGTAETLLCRRAVGDSSFVGELRKGRMVGPKVRARLLAYMEKHPDGLQAKRYIPPPKPLSAEEKNLWDVAAEARAGSETLLKATILIQPESIAPKRRLTFEEQLAIAQTRPVRLVDARVPTAGYDYSLTGGSL